MNDFICPVCQTEFKTPYRQWSVNTFCPACNSFLVIDYDEIYLPEESDIMELWEGPVAVDAPKQGLETVTSELP